MVSSKMEMLLDLITTFVFNKTSRAKANQLGIQVSRMPPATIFKIEENCLFKYFFNEDFPMEISMKKKLKQFSKSNKGNGVDVINRHENCYEQTVSFGLFFANAWSPCCSGVPVRNLFNGDSLQ